MEKRRDKDIRSAWLGRLVDLSVVGKFSSCGWSLENAVRSQSGIRGALDLVLREGAHSRESFSSRIRGFLPIPRADPQIRPAWGSGAGCSCPRLSQQRAPEGFAAVNL